MGGLRARKEHHTRDVDCFMVCIVWENGVLQVEKYLYGCI